MNQYNDYELLYLIYECDEEALGILFKKYEPLIKKRLYSFRIKKCNYDDFYQESLLTLYLAIKKYNPFNNKSFNKYFDLLLTRRIMSLLRQGKDHFYEEIITDDEAMFVDEGNVLDNMLLKSSNKELELRENVVSIGYLSSLEYEIFKLKYIEGIPNERIAKIIDEDIKKVYNSIYRMKKKIKSRLPK